MRAISRRLRQPAPPSPATRGVRSRGLLAFGGVLGVTGLLAGLLSARGVSAQDALPYQPWLSLVEFNYQPAPAGGKQVLRFKFDVSKDLPIGTKVQIDLLHQGLELDGESQIWEFKGPGRSGAIFEMRPVRPIGADDYVLQIRIPWDKQTPEVQAEFQKKPNVFPENERLGGWIWSFGKDEEVLKVGTPEEFKAQAELTCRLYDGYIAEIIKNNDDLVAAYEAAKEGKRFRNGNAVDEKALTDFVRDWRIQQGRTQRKIRVEFPQNHRAILYKSLTAHANLLRLGQMVSKRGVQIQKELETELSVGDLTPTPNPAPKGEKEEDEQDCLRSFDSTYRYTVKLEALKSTLDRIYELVCPAPEPAPEEGDAADAPKDGEKKETETPDPEKEGSPPGDPKKEGAGKPNGR